MGRRGPAPVWPQNTNLRSKILPPEIPWSPPRAHSKQELQAMTTEIQDAIYNSF